MSVPLHPKTLSLEVGQGLEMMAAESSECPLDAVQAVGRGGPASPS